MRLNLDKCVFEVQGEKFLSFMFTHRGIEANLNKCDAIIKMKSPQNVKEKPTSFHWNHDYEKAFQDFKKFLASPPILTRLVDGQDLYLYLACRSGPRGWKDIEPHILHQQDATRHKVSISDDRKTHPHPGHLDPMTTPLLPCSHNGSLKRSSHLIGTAKTRVSRKDDNLVNGAIRIHP
ncbi:hypothetical protein CR513_23135, partial [Mucuna pruriens]